MLGVINLKRSSKWWLVLMLMPSLLNGASTNLGNSHWFIPEVCYFFFIISVEYSLFGKLLCRCCVRLIYIDICSVHKLLYLLNYYFDEVLKLMCMLMCYCSLSSLHSWGKVGNFFVKLLRKNYFKSEVFVLTLERWNFIEN